MKVGKEKRYQPYPRYKDSGVEWLGEIPEGWDSSPIKHIASCNDEVLPEVTPATKEINYIEISDVEYGKGILTHQVTLFGSAPSRARRIVRKDDVIISTVRTYLKAIAPITEEHSNSIVSTGFAVIRPLSIDSRFFYWISHAEGLHAEIVARSTGVSYPAINAADLVRISVPLPQRQVQAAVAAFLDRETARIDGLIKEYEDLIALLAEKRQALISHAVTRGLSELVSAEDPEFGQWARPVKFKDSGIEWLGEIPEEWEVKKLKYIASYNDDVLAENTDPDFSFRYIEISDVEYGIGITGYQDTYFSTAPSRARRKVQEGDVIISTVRTYLKAIASIDNENQDCVVSTGFAVIRPKFIHPQYLEYFFNSEGVHYGIISRSVGVSYPAINASELVESPIPLPGYGEQKAIAAYLRRNTMATRSLKDETQSAISLLKEHRSALISNAVTGKINVEGLV